ncbi:MULTISPECIES: sensor histidine kinase [unclassified Nocardioides]|uniref:sensor histidine kinase n=1 Tax=Nocardioides sp. URHA0032 TaxID=1380388 RepID=UPI00048A50CA|nr:sensor histidine kinase [Nocardioides sp. URHA0032]
MVLFLTIGVLTAVGIIVGTNILADRAAADEAISEAKGTTQLLAQSVVAPEFPPTVVHLRPDNATEYLRPLESFDREVQARLLKTDRPYRINIWSANGRLLYTSQLDLLFKDLFSQNGTHQPALTLDDEQRVILRKGGVGSEIADPGRPEDVAAAGTEGMVRIYTRFVTTDRGSTSVADQRAAGRPVLFEAYFPVADLTERQTQIFDSFRWITAGALILLIAVATAILVGLTRQLRKASAERERLLVSAMDASDAERRRIARDLHDSVVQDLAGTAFSVSAVARTSDLPEDSRETLESAGVSLRTGLKSLRSLLAEIHPPDLSADGLPAALADLIAPAGAAGIQASVSVEGAETASDAHVALVWRVAQEAVRNAIRHSEASTLAVTVRGDGRTLALEVVDDGVGFDRSRTKPDSYGLRGLRSLVVDSGGVLDVRSSPGEGTTVWMEVDAQ